MLHRLVNAIKYLITGTLDEAPRPKAKSKSAPPPQAEPKQNGPKQSEILPPISTDIPYNTPANEASFVIMKDTYTAEDGQSTFVEVRSDGIRLERNGEEDIIPLSGDKHSFEAIDDDIRYQIARKISLLVPELADSKKEQLLKHVFNVIFFMADDQLPRVRQMIAEELRDSHDAPPELIRKLAWDEELDVAAPILEFSPLLGDSDLLQIIANSDIPGVIECVSRRQDVSSDVTDAIVRNVTNSKVSEEDALIITNLLNNKRAKFKEDTLEIIVDEAPNYEMWHASLIDRPELTTRTINKIARYVSEAMIMEMEDRGMITKELGHNLTQAIASRLHNPQIDRAKEADRLAIDLFTQGDLDASYVMAALDSGEREFVISALSLLSEIPKSATKKIIDSDNPKAVTALAWKANIPMRDAIQLQLKLAKIHYSKLLYARDGKYFPLSESQMQSLLKPYISNAA